MTSTDPEKTTSSIPDNYQIARHRLVVVWTWVGAILLGAVVLYLANILSIVIGIIIWTAVFVFLLSGPVDFFQKHGINRTLGTTFAFILLVAILCLLAFLMFSPAFGIEAQFGHLFNNLPGYFDAFHNWINSILAQYPDIFQNDSIRNWFDQAGTEFLEFVKQFASSGASGIVAVGTSVANVFICIGFAFVVAFWMLIELPNLGKEVNRLIGRKYAQDAEMLHLTVTRVMGGYLRTTIIQCAIIGVLCGILFAILGVPSPAAFGVITGLLNIIPIIGPWLGGVLAFVASFLESPLTGIIALVGVVVIQQLIYTFLSPKLMGDSVDIHPALTFIALMAGSGIGTAMGGLMGGLIGTLLSIPLVAVFKAMFVYYFEKKTGRRIVSPDGVFFKGAPQTGTKINPVADATGPIELPDHPKSELVVSDLIRELTGKIPKIEEDDKDKPERHDSSRK